MDYKIYFDGAVSESKTGCDMGLGIAVFVDDQYYDELSVFKGVKGDQESSSNVAEWLACVEAFKYINEYLESDDTVVVFSDSQLITKQYNGDYQISKPKFNAYYFEAMKLANKAKLPNLKINWIPREKNKEADKLSKKGLQLIYQSAKSK